MAPKLEPVSWKGNTPRQIIALPDGTSIGCDHGKTVRVPAEYAASLLEQDGWEKGSTKAAETEEKN